MIKQILRSTAPSKIILIVIHQAETLLTVIGHQKDCK